jgi:hypothetical protein
VHFDPPSVPAPALVEMLSLQLIDQYVGAQPKNRTTTRVHCLFKTQKKTRGLMESIYGSNGLCSIASRFMYAECSCIPRGGGANQAITIMRVLVKVLT